MSHFRFPGALFLSALCLSASLAAAAQLEIVGIPGETLKDNPLGDPPARRVAVFVPNDTKADTPLPLVVYLPGWGESSEDAIAEGRKGWIGRTVDDLAKARRPLRVAVIDGRSRYGGSQFLNSGATGRYADYVSDEVVPALEKRYALTKEQPARILSGHSSGAYGALLLAMNHQDQFAAVVALSPDSDFEVTHKGLVSQPRVQAVRQSEAEAAMVAKNFKLPSDGLAELVLGLCANYAPIAGQPGRFEWLYDERGEWRPAAWQRWLDLDPLTLVKKKADAFGPAQRIYLDGAEHDEFGANIGARKIQEVLSPRKSPVTFYESPGRHSERIPERLMRGLMWVFGEGK